MSTRYHPSSPAALARSLLTQRSLIRQMSRREIVGRYRGSFLGLFWSFINPMLLLAVYTFVFSVAFNARWGASPEGGRFEFAMVLFCGLIVFNFFAECVSRAPQLVLNNPNYVKKVVFPLEILPWTVTLSGLFHATVSTLILLAGIALAADLHWTTVFLPVIWAPFVVLVTGLSWLLASLGVFVRDISQVVGFVVTAMLFLSPIFYPVTALPESVQPILLANPLTFVIEQSRGALLWGETPDWRGLGLYTVGAGLFAWAGFAWFQRTRKGFADVL
jgi:lipopolysaccharide transport system permease protein